MDEVLQELEDKYFMLNMKDVWDSSDHRYADELREKIKRRKKELENGIKDKFGK